MAYTIIINLNKLSYEEFLKKLNNLLKFKMVSNHFLQPLETSEVNSIEDIKLKYPRFPFWFDSDWVVCGDKNKIMDSGVLVEVTDSKKTQKIFDKKVNILLEYYNWALFNSFTAYQDSNMFFVTNDIEILKLFQTTLESEKSQNVVYLNQDTSWSDLKRVSYMDYDSEGLLAYELSIDEGIYPYLICCMSYSEVGYRDFDHDLGEYIGEQWFEEPIKPLKLVDMFNVTSKISLGAEFEYRIYQATNKEAYLQLWSMASSDRNVVECTISGKSNISEVVENIKEGRFDCLNDKIISLVPWIYTQVYGGGSDEHHAVFYADNKQVTNFVVDQIEAKDIIARF